MADVEERLQEAIALGDEGRWEDMVALLTAALRDDPDDPFLLCWLGVAEQELGQEGAAYEHFRRALAEEPTNPQLLAIIGGGLAQFDDPAAERVLRTAAVSAPDVLETRLQYGRYLAREGMFAEALEHLRAAVKLDEGDAVAHGELGTALALKGDMAGAAQEMERALELAPDDSWTRLLLGLVYVEQGEDELAAEVLAQAAEETPDDAEAQILAALAAASQGWLDAAQVILARGEYSAEGSDVELLHEAEDRLADGAEAAMEMLRENLGPSVLHERLSQPF